MAKSSKSATYFESGQKVRQPTVVNWLLSRAAFPLLSLLSREQSLKLGLTPIDDERVVMALRYAKGRTVDIGCGSNVFIRSYGNGTGVDVFPWEGCDVVVENSAKLPFEDESFDTSSFLACLNHIPNREEAVKEAFRVTRAGGQIMLSMIGPSMGAFIHWWRQRNDPDHKERCINHDEEMMGMSDAYIRKLLGDAGFTNIRRKKFVFGLNNFYLADRP